MIASEPQKQQEQHSNYSADFQVEGQLFQNDKLRLKNLIFAIILTFIQGFFCWVYGFLLYSPPSLINVSSILTAISLAILIIAGFGLVFGYTKRLLWSGLGFNLFIMVFCLQWYPIVNDFWTRTQIQTQNNPLLNFSYANRYYNLYLSNRDTSPTGQLTYYGNNITNAMKCALAVAVAFSSILGRAGQLECLIITVLGTIGFELNRQCIQERIGADSFGTFFIFTFGGFMGLALGLFCYLRQRKVENQIRDISLSKYTGDSISVFYSMFGALIIFAFFPFLAFEIDGYIFQNIFSASSAPFLILLAMGAGSVGSICISILINGSIIVRDATHGLIAGAIATGAGSLYMNNPVYALITGFIAGMIQAAIQSIFQRIGIQKNYILSTVSWSLFGIQGFIGGCFASGWKKMANNNNSSNFSSNVLKNYGEQYQFYAMLVSAGIGLVFGIGAGLFVYFFDYQTSNEYFDDGYYWRNSDCIRTRRKKAMIVPQTKSQSIIIEFREGQEEEIHNNHAYL